MERRETEGSGDSVTDLRDDDCGRIRHGEASKFWKYFASTSEVGSRVSIFFVNQDAFHSLSKTYGIVLLFASRLYVPVFLSPIMLRSLSWRLYLPALRKKGRHNTFILQNKVPVQFAFRNGNR